MRYWFKRLAGRRRVQSGREDYLKHKEQARAIVKERIDYFNQIYGFSFNRVAVKNHKSRWGSCSRKGNLNFNYRVIFLPERLMDYIIVHELCHLKELNHSRRFWNLVALAKPDFRQLKRELKHIHINVA